MYNSLQNHATSGSVHELFPIGPIFGIQDSPEEENGEQVPDRFNWGSEMLKLASNHGIYG